jgi:uncharacterized protein YdaU (DUF1376 family)
MYYYKHHIGDYRRDTSHLTLLEHGIYRQMLDTYYLTEQPLPLDHAKVMRLHCVRTAEEIQAAENVLAEFFTATDAGYIHTRCEAEIADFHGKSNKASESAKARWNNKVKEIKDIPADANAMRTHTERNADAMLTNNHKPITNNQEFKTKNRHASVPAVVQSRFDEIRLAYPKRGGSQKWGDAERAYNARLAEGHTHEEILSGCERYNRFLTATGKVNTEFVQQAATFLGRNKGFTELWQPPAQVKDVRQMSAVERVQLATERLRSERNERVVSEQTGSSFGSLEQLMRDVR